MEWRFSDEVIQNSEVEVCYTQYIHRAVLRAADIAVGIISGTPSTVEFQYVGSYPNRRIMPKQGSGLSCSNVCLTKSSQVKGLIPLNDIAASDTISIEDFGDRLSITFSDSSGSENIILPIIQCYSTKILTYSKNSNCHDLNQFFNVCWNKEDGNGDGVDGIISLRDGIYGLPQSEFELILDGLQYNKVRFLPTCFDCNEWTECDTRFAPLPYAAKIWCDRKAVTTESGSTLEVDSVHGEKALFKAIGEVFPAAVEARLYDCCACLNEVFDYYCNTSFPNDYCVTSLLECLTVMKQHDIYVEQLEFLIESIDLRIKQDQQHEKSANNNNSGNRL